MENTSNTVVQSTDTKPESTGDSALVKGLLDPEIKGEFSGVLTTLSAFRQQITMLQNQVRGLEKHVDKKMKTLQREAKKNKNKGNRKPSGFAVPTKITDQLCEFMNKEKGTMVARTEVTQYIIEYIRQNALQKDGNRKFIKPDVKLATLLDVKDDDEVTYFNIQRYMNKHFVKEKA
jgi:chromatin remodeling complex protein RSC6